MLKLVEIEEENYFITCMRVCWPGNSFTWGRVRVHSARQTWLSCDLFQLSVTIFRYNAERLSNGLPRTVVFPVAQGAIIDQGYFAHLADSNSGLRWTDRISNVPFTVRVVFVILSFSMNIPVIHYFSVLYTGHSSSK